MRRYGDPVTRLEFWIECPFNHTTNSQMKLYLDDDGCLVVEGVCEYGHLVREFFPLAELLAKSRPILRDVLEL
jgi:hypothetical protein